MALLFLTMADMVAAIEASVESQLEYLVRGVIVQTRYRILSCEVQAFALPLLRDYPPVDAQDLSELPDFCLVEIADGEYVRAPIPILREVTQENLGLVGGPSDQLLSRFAW